MKNCVPHVSKLIGLMLLTCVAAHAQNSDAAVISKFIAAQARELHGQEYRDARKVLTGDLDHDGVADAAVLYTIEGMNGGNNYVQYLAVFLRENGKLVAAAHTVVGGKLNREVSLQAIQDGVIVFRTKSYAKNDAACCPSKPGTARFALADGKLTEEKSPGN